MLINLQWSIHVHSSCSAFFRSHFYFSATCHSAFFWFRFRIISLVEDHAIMHLLFLKSMVHQRWFKTISETAQRPWQFRRTRSRWKQSTNQRRTSNSPKWRPWRRVTRGDSRDMCTAKKRQNVLCPVSVQKTHRCDKLSHQTEKISWRLLRLRLNIRCQPQKGYTIHLWTDRWPGSTGLMRMITTYLHLLHNVQYHDQRFLWWGWTPDAYRKTSNYNIELNCELPKISTFQHVPMRRDK